MSGWRHADFVLVSFGWPPLRLPLSFVCLRVLPNPLPDRIETLFVFPPVIAPAGTRGPFGETVTRPVGGFRITQLAPKRSRGPSWTPPTTLGPTLSCRAETHLRKSRRSCGRNPAP